ncbi:MAG: SGNH/GDSL hydrolase family protein [Ruminococcaceae bacterium]|nr:SGNH/GDSL hydrolase family protein [Oscillospiraceae bacterium]
MTIAFLGDSITFGYGLDNKEGRYSTLVSQFLGMTEQNYGITGTLVAKAGLNQSDGNDFLSRAYLIDGADVAVIFGGTNDYFWSDKPIYGNGNENFEAAVKSLVDRVKEKRKGKITLFVTPYPHNGIGNYFGGVHWKDSNRHNTSEKNYHGHCLIEYVSVIESVCKENGIPCLNLHEDFNFVWQEHTTDGCHPNESGHVLIANAIIGRLEKMIRCDLHA